MHARLGCHTRRNKCIYYQKEVLRLFWATSAGTESPIQITNTNIYKLQIKSQSPIHITHTYTLTQYK